MMTDTLKHDEAQREHAIETLERALDVARTQDVVSILVIGWRGDGSWREWTTGDLDVTAAVGKLEVIRQATIARYFAERPPRGGDF
jgi:hypothetical protein